MLDIKGCTGPVEAWETLCNIHKTKSLSNILFLRRKFFTIKIEEGNAHESAMEFCYKRLGHLHVNGVKGLQSMVVGMDLGKGASQILICEECIEDKQARASFPSD